MKFQSNFIEGLQSLKFLAKYNNNGAAERDLEKNNETYQMKKFNEQNNNRGELHFLYLFYSRYFFSR